MHTINETLRFVNISSALTLRPNPHELRVTFFHYYRFEPATTHCCKSQHRMWNKPTPWNEYNMQQRATCNMHELRATSPLTPRRDVKPTALHRAASLVPSSAPRCVLHVRPNCTKRLSAERESLSRTQSGPGLGRSVRRLCWFGLFGSERFLKYDALACSMPAAMYVCPPRRSARAHPWSKTRQREAHWPTQVRAVSAVQHPDHRLAVRAARVRPRELQPLVPPALAHTLSWVPRVPLTRVRPCLPAALAHATLPRTASS